MENHKELFETFTKNRPRLSLTSIKTYISSLSSLYKKLEQIHSGFPDVNYFLNNCSKIISYLKDDSNSISLNRRKLILAAIVVLIKEFQDTDQYKRYQSQMIDDANQYNKSMKNQEKSENQKTNWITQDEIKNKYLEYNKNIKSILKIPNEKLTNNNIRYLNDWIIISLYSLIPPRRLQDYLAFKNPHLSNINESIDNYYNPKKNQLIFNDYKTHRTYGTQFVTINSELKKNLNAYLKKIKDLPVNTLIFNENSLKPFTPSLLNKRLYQIFNKHVSVNILRHSYITENVLKNMPKYTELETIANDMGHSTSQQILYKKF